MSETVLAPGSRTLDQTESVSSLSGHGQPDTIAFVVDITDLELGTPSIQVTISGIDTVSGKRFELLQSAVLSAVALTRLTIGPQLTGSANLVAKDIIPENIEVFVEHTDAQDITYSIGMIHG